MKAKALVVLVLAGVWGLASWWWYACNIKGFCGTPLVHAEDTTDTHSTETTTKTADSLSNKIAPADTDTPLNNAQLSNAPSTSNQLLPETSANSHTVAVPEPSQELKDQPKPPEPKVETSTPTITASVETATVAPSPTTATQTTSVTPTEAEPKPEASIEATKVETATIDPPVSTEPVTTSADDSDKDGVPNELEKKLGLDPYMADSDKDGVSDQDELGEKPAEAPLDTDDDGIINALDTDDDGDGDLTANEAVDPNKDSSVADARDSDQDGIPDYLDKDSGWATLDDDNDGISNGEEKEAGTNPTLTDSDGDSVPDSVELADKKDTDEDGILDALDTDDDNDGIMTAMENPDPNSDVKLADAVDHNKNGVPDYLDAKSSGETVVSSNSNTEPNPKDPDMATGKAVAKPVQLTQTEPSKTEEAIPTNSEDQKASTTDKEPKEDKPVVKADDTNKITVDLDKTTDKKNVSSARLYFPFRSSKPELADSTAEYFDDLISFLKANPKATVKVIGHTDNVGDADINEKLGLQRAERIRTQLIKRGAPADRVEASSKGESTPWVSNKTEEGRNKNRRVEVKPIK